MREVLDLIEAIYARGDEDEQELIAVSFLENLPYPGEDGADVRDLLGSELRRQLDEIVG